MIDYKEKAKHFLFDFCAGGDSFETADEGLARMEKELRELVEAARAEVVAPKIIVRTNADASLDEAFLEGGSFHLEQMSDTHWWMALTLGKQEVHIGLHSRAKIVANISDEGEVELLTDANSTPSMNLERSK